MKKNNFSFYVFIFVNIAIGLSCLFYPVSRDEFYYLDKINFPNPFDEYYLSYHFGNPRIGQLFGNLISRNSFAEVVFGIILFNSFVAVLFLNIYRKLPDLRKVNEMIKFLWLAAYFIFFINYFGEMFYYTPYSTNYTFTTIFYLLFVFVISDYYFYKNEKILTEVPYLFLIVIGLFIGMSNEHVPPVLVAVSFLFGLIYFYRVKKLPNFKLIVIPFFITLGYAFLFFAPANKIKQKVVGKSVLDIQFTDYIANWVKIFKTYFYYNRELLLLIAVLFVVFLIWNKKIKKVFYLSERLLFWVFLFILPLMIVAFSPLIGTRLLFFSTCVLLIGLYRIILNLLEHKVNRFSDSFLYAYCLLFFGTSIMTTFRANQNYENLISEIEQKKLHTKDVELDHQLNYFTLGIGSYLNRKIFLESGEDYIDEDASEDTAMELNLKKYFELKSIKEK